MSDEEVKRVAHEHLESVTATLMMSDLSRCQTLPGPKGAPHVSQNLPAGCGAPHCWQNRFCAAWPSGVTVGADATSVLVEAGAACETTACMGAPGLGACLLQQQRATPMPTQIPTPGECVCNVDGSWSRFVVAHFTTLERTDEATNHACDDGANRSFIGQLRLLAIWPPAARVLVKRKAENIVGRLEIETLRRPSSRACEALTNSSGDIAVGAPLSVWAGALGIIALGSAAVILVPRPALVHGRRARLLLHPPPFARAGVSVACIMRA